MIVMKKIVQHCLQKIVWILAAAIVLYLILGAILPYTHQPEVKEETKSAFTAADYYGTDVIEERAGIISDNGEALEERIRLIAQAKERIVLSTFEFHADESGKAILAALIAAAERGVQVSVLADGIPYLVSMVGEEYFYALSSMENAQIKIYNPVNPLKPWTVMGSLHDKYLIVDDFAYILGGRNTYDFFLGNESPYKNYDWDVLVYTNAPGTCESLNKLSDYFDEIWNMEVCKLYHDESSYQNRESVKQAKEELQERYKKLQKEHADWFTACDYTEKTSPVNKITVVSNPTHIDAKEPVVYYTITELMKQAQNEVVFHTPYIIGNEFMIDRLKEVSDSVPKVTMMTNSVANNGNPFGAMDYQQNKEKILDTGVQILEYEGGYSYHGKCFVMDNRISGVGSFNWDMRSAYLDTEIMLIIDSEEFNSILRDEMNVYEERALQVVDKDTSIPPEGEEAQSMSGKKKRVLKLLHIFAGWARFLM